MDTQFKIEEQAGYIGYVVGGGLKENLKVRLEVPAHHLQEGGFTVIESGDWLFYGLITDFQLGATDPRFGDEKIENRLPPNLASMLHGQTLYTNLEILPVLMLERGPDPANTLSYRDWLNKIERGLHPNPRPLPVKSIPAHHAKVRLAGEGDIAEIFGKSSDPGNFVIGYTREQGYPICINLDKFIQRSAGIFGATGTGKSFLTRIILAGLAHYDCASLLIFDMHNEYAYDDTSSDTGQRVTGLKTKFPSRVRVVGLGQGALIRNNAPDFNLEIAMSDIQPEDIELLSHELNLRETTPTILDALVSAFGRQHWFEEFRKLKVGATIETDDGKRLPAPDSVEAWAAQAGVHAEAAKGLHSKLGALFRRPYILAQPASDGVSEAIKALEAGQHVILSFGKFESDLDYLLVSNLLTRHIRQAWEQRANSFRTTGENEPRPLVVVVEEAHKLLNHEMAAQTTFNVIARELRKYYVTLLIVDQRPSQIYDEVMSQLGTRISGWLGDEEDIRAVLSGLAGRETLRGMLARLQPKEEVLLLGWGVPMPLPIHSQRYDEHFWSELLGKPAVQRNPEQILGELGF